MLRSDNDSTLFKYHSPRKPLKASCKDLVMGYAGDGTWRKLNEIQSRTLFTKWHHHSELYPPFHGNSALVTLLGRTFCPWHLIPQFIKRLSISIHDRSTTHLHPNKTTLYHWESFLELTYGIPTQGLLSVFTTWFFISISPFDFFLLQILTMFSPQDHWSRAPPFDSTSMVPILPPWDPWLNSFRAQSGNQWDQSSCGAPPSDLGLRGAKIAS